MAKLWEGITDGAQDAVAEDFNASIRVDKRMFEEDILGSIAHVTMLGKVGVIEEKESQLIAETLACMLDEIKSGKLVITNDTEDIHSFVELELTARLGDLGKKLHTARSRNDQVALDLRLNLMKEIKTLAALAENLQTALLFQAKKHVETIMPGYTHLQRAQPVSFAQHLMAYVEMLERDKERLWQTYERTAVSPLGAAALAGTSYPINRQMTAELLGMSGVFKNSMDAVSDRDFVLELASDLAILMMHLSRLSEEIILWSGFEFGFISLNDNYSTGSSIMPQKKNPDMAELVRGKSGRVFGNLMALLTVMKGLPLAYNKDMQEDKELIFSSVDTAKVCLEVAAGMIKTMKAKPDNMHQAAAKGFINATDLADYLVYKGLAFRDAYKISGQIVAHCTEKNCSLETLDLDTYKSFCPLIDEGVYEAVDLLACLKRRNSEGGTAPEAVKAQIQIFLKKLNLL